VHFQRKESDAQYDGIFYLFRLKDLVRRRGERLVQLFRSGQVKLFLQNYESRIETIRINAIRRAFDRGTLNFDVPFEEHKYQQMKLELDSNDLVTTSPASEEEIRTFIFHKAFWGYRYNPANERYPIQFDEPIDCEYLGVSAQDIRRNVWLLKEQGWLEKVLEGHGRASHRLVTEYESRYLQLRAAAPSQRSREVLEKEPEEFEWDFFISHAHEDKAEIARPLADALKARKVRVWFDEGTLTLGDSLRQSMDRGLARSRFGIVILSPNFFAKHWPQQELNGLATRERAGKKVILPVWHTIGREDVTRESPILADRLAVSTAKGLEEVVRAVLAVIWNGESPVGRYPKYCDFLYWRSAVCHSIGPATYRRGANVRSPDSLPLSSISSDTIIRQMSRLAPVLLFGRHEAKLHLMMSDPLLDTLLQCAAMSIEQVIQFIDEQISRLQRARAALNGTGSGKAEGRGRGPRTMSAAARARIAAAQRAR
jgi:hypothetical protein